MRTGYEENGISIHTILLFELSIFFCCIKLLYIIYMYCFIFFLSDFLLEQIYKFRFSCQLALYIQLLERFGVSIVTKNVFKTSSTSLLLCYMHVMTFSYSRGKQISWILPLFANFFLQQLEWTITKYLQQLFGDLNAQQKLDNKLTIIISIKKVNWILHCQWFFFLFLTWLGLLEILTQSCLLQFTCQTSEFY